jgi:hypothetical protein
VKLRRVRLRVDPVPWLEHYHGREAGLVGEVVDAVELDDAGMVAYVDDRDGEASEYVEALEHIEAASSEAGFSAAHGGPYALAGGRRAPTSRQLARVRRELREHAARRLLHGEVLGVRT